VGLSIKSFQRSSLTITTKVWSDNLKYNDIIAACQRSLNRLQTSYIDLYLIHHPSNTIPLEESMLAMDYLKKKALIKDIGVSNFTVDLFKKAQLLSSNKICVNQIHYNIANREHQDMVSYAQQNDILITAYRPLEKGFLLDKDISELQVLSKKYNKTPAQIALNWLICKKNIVLIAKTVNIKHLQENIGALIWKLEEKDIEMLDRLNLTSIT
jgi:diketogulonate reductase-like aldo/keto reductase